MAKNIDTIEKCIKDEYEMQLYGFTLDDFKEENFYFINHKIKKAMNFMNEKFCGMIKDIKPEVKNEILATTKAITKKIESDCKKNIEKLVNTEIDELLTIPRNVILPEDKINLEKTPEISRDSLENECHELVQIMYDNSLFIAFLEKEYNSYAIKDVLGREDELIRKAEDYLNASYDINICLESLRKAHNFNRQNDE